MLYGARDSEGRVYEIVSAPPGGTARKGGIAYSDLGQMYITETAPVGGSFENGYMFDVAGSLYCGPGPAVTYVGGIPLNAAGAMAVDKVGTPSVTDPWIAGTRVGPNGVYLNAGVPPFLNAFSSGFNVGYGN